MNTGITPEKNFVEYDPAVEDLNIGCVVKRTSGVAAELGVEPGDKVITHISHKPRSLARELEQRFPTYSKELFSAERLVRVDNRTYSSRFEGALLTK